MSRDELQSEILKAMLSEAASGRREGFNGLARAVVNRLQELRLPLDGLTVPPPRKRRAIPLNRRIAVGPEARHEAEAIIAGIHTLHDRFTVTEPKED